MESSKQGGFGSRFENRIDAAESKPAGGGAKPAEPSQKGDAAGTRTKPKRGTPPGKKDEVSLGLHQDEISDISKAYSDNVGIPTHLGINYFDGGLKEAIRKLSQIQGSNLKEAVTNAVAEYLERAGVRLD